MIRAFKKLGCGFWTRHLLLLLPNGLVIVASACHGVLGNSRVQTSQSLPWLREGTRNNAVTRRKLSAIAIPLLAISCNTRRNTRVAFFRDEWVSVVPRMRYRHSPAATLSATTSTSVRASTYPNRIVPHSTPNTSARFSRVDDDAVDSDNSFRRETNAPGHHSDAGHRHVIFLRHGCTYMNEYLSQPGCYFGAPRFTDIFSSPERERFYLDTPLSPNGIRQAKALADTRPDFLAEDIDLVVVSPLTRALQTFDYGIYPHVKHAVDQGTLPVVALPLSAERLYLISDCGKPVSQLQQDFPYVSFDGITDKRHWWYLPDRDCTTHGPYVEWRPLDMNQQYACSGEPADSFETRMMAFMTWLERRNESRILIVSHHGVMERLLGMDFDNCQYQSFSFAYVRERVKRRTLV